MTTKTYIQRIAPALRGKTVAISGATGGLGQALCYHLAACGASLILVDRNAQKQQALLASLRKEFPQLHAAGLQADLEQLDEVCAVARQLIAQPPDALILNAGAYSIPRHQTSDGYDNVFQINFVAPYLLAHLVLPTLRARGGRVVAVGSIAHRYSKIDLDDVDFSTRKQASLVYGNAKRHLIYACLALARDGAPVTVVHPGISLTGITDHYPKWLFALIKHPMRVIFMPPRRACLSILQGLIEPPSAAHWIGPRCFDVWGLPRTRRLRSADATERAIIEQRAADIVRRRLTER